MKPQQVLGNNVRRLREAKGWSQDNLVEKANLHRTCVSRIERGARNPSLNIAFNQEEIMKRVNTKKTAPRFQQILSQSLIELEMRIRTDEVRNAKEADEAAAEIAGNTGYSMTSEGGEELLAALYDLAGKSFPGAWEIIRKRTVNDLLNPRSPRASLLGQPSFHAVKTTKCC